MRAKRALAPSATTPQGKTRTRSLGDDWGAAVDILCWCNVFACSSLSCFRLSDADGFSSCLLHFLIVVGYAKTCWRDGDARNLMLLLVNMAA